MDEQVLEEEEEEIPVEKVPELMEQGLAAFALKEFDAAQDHFSRALQTLCRNYGEQAPECGEAYYQYGLTLLNKGIRKSTLLGSSENAEENEKALITTVKEMLGKAYNTAKGLSKSNRFVFEGQVEDEQEETKQEPAASSSDAPAAVQEEDEECEDEEEVEDDMQLAWEILENARLIYSNIKEAKADDKDATLRLADIHMHLGTISMETETWDAAIEDFTKALNFKKSVLAADNRQIAEAYYDLGLVQEFSEKFEDAITNMNHSVTVLKERLVNLESQLKEASTEKGKDAATEADVSAVTIEKEIKDIQEILPEIDNKIEDIKKRQTEEKPSADDEETLAKKTTEDGPVQDVSKLVKTKKSADASTGEKRKLEEAEDATKKPKVEEASA